jgi:hypothetical protein
MSDDDLYSHSEPPEIAREPRDLPLVILAAALFVALAVETVQLADERGRLVELREAQAPQMQEAVKFREQLEALGSETARLADGGDVSAKKIVDAMRQQGVTLKGADK